MNRLLIVDIDKTLALIPDGGRHPFAFEEAESDLPSPLVPLLRDLPEWGPPHSGAPSNGWKIAYVTGRPEAARTITTSWLSLYELPTGPLWMRSDGDYRPAEEVKRELVPHATAIDGPATLAIEDDPIVAHEYKKMGIPTIRPLFDKPPKRVLVLTGPQERVVMDALQEYFPEDKRTQGVVDRVILKLDFLMAEGGN